MKNRCQANLSWAAKPSAMRIVSNKNLNHASRRRRLHGRGDCGPCGGVTGTGAPCVPRTDLGTLPSNNDDPVLVTRFSAAFTYLLVATRLAGWACKTFELRRVENAARAQCQDLGRMLAWQELPRFSAEMIRRQPIQQYYALHGRLLPQRASVVVTDSEPRRLAPLPRQRPVASAGLRPTPASFTLNRAQARCC